MYIEYLWQIVSVPRVLDTMMLFLKSGSWIVQKNDIQEVGHSHT